ncbi:MAG: hypothetical protein WD942_06490 [Dehalococcoidia bacterium]
MKSNARFSTQRLAVLAIVTISLTGCATGSSEPRIATVCPPVVEYTREFQARAAEELGLLPDGSAITEDCSADQAGLDITSVALGQVLVLADQDDRIGPETFGVTPCLVGVVICQAGADTFGFANVRKLPILRVFVGADQDVDTRSLDLRKCFSHSTKLVSAKGDGLDCGHRNLRHPDAVRVAVEKEYVDRTGFRREIHGPRSGIEVFMLLAHLSGRSRCSDSMPL